LKLKHDENTKLVFLIKTQLINELTWEQLFLIRGLLLQKVFVFHKIKGFIPRGRIEYNALESKSKTKYLVLKSEYLP